MEPIYISDSTSESLNSSSGEYSEDKLDSILDKHDFKILTFEELEVVQDAINSGRVSINKVSILLHIARETFKRKMKEKGFYLMEGKPGRKSDEIDPVFKKILLSIHMETGYGVSKSYQTYLHDYEEHIIKTGKCFSYNMAVKIWTEESLFKFERTHTKVGRTKYVACYSNLIWHVDIHLLGGNMHRPFYSIIDDYSRYIVGYKRLPDRTAQSCLNVLKSAIQNCEKPFCVWSDNGSETLNVFSQFLNENSIKVAKTKPHCPQQNGKIERFWQTFETLRKNNSIDEAIERYNNTPHTALPKVTIQTKSTVIKRHMTPKEAYNDEEHRWRPDIAPLWRVDGEIREFLADNDDSASSSDFE